MSGPLFPLDTSPALSHLKQLTMPQKKPLLPPLLYSLTKNCLLGTSHVVLHDQRTPPGQDQGTFHGQSYEKVFFFSSFLTFSFFFLFSSSPSHLQFTYFLAQNHRLMRSCFLFPPFLHCLKPPTGSLASHPFLLADLSLVLFHTNT